MRRFLLHLIVINVHLLLRLFFLCSRFRVFSFIFDFVEIVIVVETRFLFGFKYCFELTVYFGPIQN